MAYLTTILLLTTRSHSTDALTPPFTQQAVLPANRFTVQSDLRLWEIESLQMTPLENSARCIG